MWQHANPLADTVFDRESTYNWSKFSQSDITNPWSMVTPMTPPSMSHQTRDIARPFKEYQRSNLNISGNPYYGSPFQPTPVSLLSHSEASCLPPCSPTTTTSPTMPLSCNMTGSVINGMVGEGMRGSGVGGSMMSNLSSSPMNAMMGTHSSSNMSRALNVSNPVKVESDNQKPQFDSNTSVVPTNMSTTAKPAGDVQPPHSPDPMPESNINDRDYTIDGIKIPPKKRHLAIPEYEKDITYWDKRKKNNDSAKRSRESRRRKEEQIAMRVVYLEQENLQLRTEVSLLKNDIEKLRCMLYSC